MAKYLRKQLMKLNARRTGCIVTRDRAKKGLVSAKLNSGNADRSLRMPGSMKK